ncbi:hypothetical protein SGR_143 [Streptomyces griseus subsp. griseus NBRC 13350]|uniref:Uncharacterized protein n=1 Tax=Streptomyces griseus subsp. griseus (strain JCM 4626 / CBS 651.72 / NBRC 13350 / KCC S-0626 / ISP 5235) TaxID=455632 RepID=B1VNE9_STRGG|nr:hypothetical protein SGR_143 [Streptomyces griseus subsp. griseus NBRC 13350]
MRSRRPARRSRGDPRAARLAHPVRRAVYPVGRLSLSGRRTRVRRERQGDRLRGAGEGSRSSGALADVPCAVPSLRSSRPSCWSRGAVFPGRCRFLPRCGGAPSSFPITGSGGR